MDDLFSRLRAASHQQGHGAAPLPSASDMTGWSHPQQQYQHPSVSTPLVSPPTHTPDPVHPSSVMSPVQVQQHHHQQQQQQQPPRDSKEARLLDLLKSRTPSSSQQPGPLAALRKVSNAASADASRSTSVFSHLGPRNAYGEYLNSPSSGNPQDFLLNLLNQPTRAAETVQPPLQAPQPVAPTSPLLQQKSNTAGEPPSASSPPQDADAASLHQPRMRVFGSMEPQDTTLSFNPSNQTSQQRGPFNYVNPFESLSTPATADAKTNEVRPAPGEPVINTTEEQSSKNQSVSQALNDVGDEVDKQIKKALAQAVHPHPTVDPADDKTSSKRQKTTNDIADSWESADMDEQDKKSSSAVRVYNLPMRPFIALHLRGAKQPVSLRPASLMDIARMKKDFDQLDRNLVAASDCHIVYAMAKNAGFRVISQDSGRDKQVFRSNQERLVHVQVSAYKDNEFDHILATGVNGTTYWTRVKRTGSEKFEDADLEAAGLVLPPMPVATDENTSQSPIKTRAKLSSKHSELFAFSRGKSINLISHDLVRVHYIDSATRIVNVSKYLDLCGQKITTPKSCKDFAFSEDDTIIATLDKSGRIRFWDIRALVDAAVAKQRKKIDQQDSILSFVSSLASEKLSPTSIMFLDRERAYTRGAALRYVLVGFKQNHILQLWDLALGKAVQEVQLPHDNDMDAICSIAYHPASCMIVIGHPTRNSIFYAYLSTPRYTLTTMDQARYMTLLASNDQSLPKPDSTAIMGSIREVSFESKGSLRSIEICRTPAATNAGGTDHEKALFELYAMHSKGVTCISVTQQDLGLDANNKAVSPIEGLEVGYLTVAPLGAPATEAPPAVAEGASASKDTEVAQRNTSTIVSQPAADESVENNGRSSEMPVRNKRSSLKRNATHAKSDTANTTPESFVVVGKGASESESAPEANGRTATKDDLVLSEQSGSDALRKGFEQLYRKIDDDRRLQDAAANARQSAVLELVSSTLTDNVERSLDKIVTDGIQSKVMPALMAQTSSVLDKRIKEELDSLLSRHVKTALGDTKVMRLLSDALVPGITDTLRLTLEKTIIPQLSEMAMTNTQKAMKESEARFAAQLQQVESQRRTDEAKLERLHRLVMQLSGTINDMASVQHAFQEQILKQQQRLGPSESKNTAGSRGGSVTLVIEEEFQQQQQPSPEEKDEDLAKVARMLLSANPENAMFEWVRNVDRHREIFEVVLSRYEPRRLPKLETVLVLSVLCVLVEDDWTQSRLSERLAWLQAMFSNLSSEELGEPELASAVPRVMSKIWTQLRDGYSKLQRTGACSRAELDVVSQLCARLYQLAPTAVV